MFFHVLCVRFLLLPSAFCEVYLMSRGVMVDPPVPHTTIYLFYHPGRLPSRVEYSVRDSLLTAEKTTYLLGR